MDCLCVEGRLTQAAQREQNYSGGGARFCQCVAAVASVAVSVCEMVCLSACLSMRFEHLKACSCLCDCPYVNRRIAD